MEPKDFLENLEIEADNAVLIKSGKRFLWSKAITTDESSTPILNNGISGWVDDGTNFRLTFTNGIITAIGNSESGGHS
jgi:hypothetical protein